MVRLVRVEFQVERRADALFALDPNTTAVGDDDPASDGEPESRTGTPRSVRLPVPVEDVIPTLRRDPDPGVRHRKDQVGLARLRAEIDPSARGGKFQRIADEIREDL